MQPWRPDPAKLSAAQLQQLQQLALLQQQQLQQQTVEAQHQYLLMQQQQFQPGPPTGHPTGALPPYMLAQLAQQQQQQQQQQQHVHLQMQQQPLYWPFNPMQMQMQYNVGFPGLLPPQPPQHLYMPQLPSLQTVSMEQLLPPVLRKRRRASDDANPERASSGLCSNGDGDGNGGDDADPGAASVTVTLSHNSSSSNSNGNKETDAEAVRARRKRRRIKPWSSQYQGVSWHKRDKRWVARVWVDSKTENLGTFVDELHAAVMVDRRVIQAFGEKAGGMPLNFPDKYVREAVARKYGVDIPGTGSEDHEPPAEAKAADALADPVPAAAAEAAEANE